MPLHRSHWGDFDAVAGPDGLVVTADAADPSPAHALLRNVPAMLDERVRVLAPHVRRGWLERGPGEDDRRGRDEFVPISWDRVLPLLADELARVRGRHGSSAIYAGSYGWASAGRFHRAQGQLHRFHDALGGATRSIGTYSTGASIPLLRHVVGTDRPITRATGWPVLARHTELFVCFGGMPAKNQQVNPGGIRRHDAAGHLRAARERGARFVLLSPLRDDLAADLGADWIAPAPGTDTALVLALVHALVVRDLHDAAFLSTHCTGWQRWWRYVSGAEDGVVKDARWAAAITGVPAERIVALALDMAAHRTMITLSLSLQRAPHGEQPLWAGIALACVLGQIGLPGGGFGHGYGAIAGIGGPRAEGLLPTMPLVMRPDVHRDVIPVARIADALLLPGDPYEFDGQHRTYPRLRLVHWAGGNPFHHHQDLARLRRAFTRPDTVIVHEQVWTATARHADVVLPATTTLERDDLGATRDDDALVAMRRVTEPLGQARSDFAILRPLAHLLGVGDVFDEGRDERAWLEHLYAACRIPGAPSFEEFWAAGRIELPQEQPHESDRVLYADFRADPVGNKLPTPSGRIELHSATIAAFGYADCPGHPTHLPLPEEPGFPLVLVANNPATRLHSQLDHGEGSRASKVAGREPVRMNPADAALIPAAADPATPSGAEAGDVVRIVSRVGSVLAGLVLSDDVAPGVVQLSTGAWFDPSAPEVATCVHGNPNAVTADVPTSQLSQACAGQLTRVRVERFDDPRPPVRAHEPPS